MDERIAELRDVVTANYEDIRTLFHSMRDGDLAKVTASGWPVWKAAGHIVLSQAADVRVARRLAAGKSATPLRIVRLLDGLAEWRSMRAFAKATRADLLAAWENSFNELFSCINDISAEPLDVSAASSERTTRRCGARVPATEPFSLAGTGGDPAPGDRLVGLGACLLGDAGVYARYERQEPASDSFLWLRAGLVPAPCHRDARIHAACRIVDRRTFRRAGTEVGRPSAMLRRLPAPVCLMTATDSYRYSTCGAVTFSAPDELNRATARRRRAPSDSLIPRAGAQMAMIRPRARRRSRVSSSSR